MYKQCHYLFQGRYVSQHFKLYVYKQCHYLFQGQYISQHFKLYVYKQCHYLFHGRCGSQHFKLYVSEHCHYLFQGRYVSEHSILASGADNDRHVCIFFFINGCSLVFVFTNALLIFVLEIDQIVLNRIKPAHVITY